MNNPREPVEQLPPSQRRLQREPDFTGGRLSSFRDVFLRHGLPGLLAGGLCLLHPNMRELLADGIASAVARPVLYLGVGLAVLVALNVYAFVIDRGWQLQKLGWVLYLGAVSVWEEWVFRLALPYFAENEGVPLLPAIVACNLAFGVMHYFTLRWRWQWCVAAFLGGMALSRNFGQHFDLLLVIGIHWVATFMNTPRAPGARR